MDPSPDPAVRLAGDGLTLAADTYGPPDGPPVVLFHGGGQTRHAWGGTARLLGDKGWRSTTVDLRGHGDSGGRGGTPQQHPGAHMRSGAPARR